MNCDVQDQLYKSQDGLEFRTESKLWHLSEFRRVPYLPMRFQKKMNLAQQRSHRPNVYCAFTCLTSCRTHIEIVRHAWKNVFPCHARKRAQASPSNLASHCPVDTRRTEIVPEHTVESMVRGLCSVGRAEAWLRLVDPACNRGHSPELARHERYR